MSILANKIAWITGGGTGIGLAGALSLAQAGARVIISGRRAEKLEQAVGDIKAKGGNAEAIVLDVADAAAVQNAAGSILKRHGRIDILVNSAGLNSVRRYWKDLTTEAWSQVIRVNLDGTMHCVGAVLPSMRERKDGLIINISSWAGRYDSYLPGAAYTAAKRAVLSLNASINMEECVNGIRSCAICPAEVATDILKKRPVPPSPEDMAKMLQPEDLGRTIRFVAEMRPHVCVNEILISPTWNRAYIGGLDVRRG